MDSDLSGQNTQTADDLNATIRVDVRAMLPAGPEQPGDMIDRYKLLEMLGEGGFGTVWRAEQFEPIHREVALKVIKAGMDSKEITARFAAERQALAMMDHPNIAAVLDAGTMENGRPFFAMELVRGVPLTEFCDARKLTIRQRLELFMPVCQAVQHAHQKAILHRDLKPSNILVVEVDGKAVPKVIDFGIAKALSGAEEEAFQASLARTQAGMIIGTPQYMSPEQAGSVPDVDTRSDVYALGVILYELLTGQTPLSRDRLRQAGLDEILRLIREEDAPRPSSRVLPQSGGAGLVATTRQTEPGKLTRTLRGDLDWILLKALEKDRQRRYGTAAALAQDLELHLRQEPVSAAAPTWRYRLAKFSRRNRAMLVTSGLITASLLCATAISLHQTAVAKQSQGHAEANFSMARAAVEQYLARVTGDPKLNTADFHDLRRQLLETAVPFYEKFAELKSEDPKLQEEQARVLGNLAQVYFATGNEPKAETTLRRSLEIQRHLAASFPGEGKYVDQVTGAEHNLALLLNSQGRPLEVDPGPQNQGNMAQPSSATTARTPATQINEALKLQDLAESLAARGNQVEAEAAYRQALDGFEKLATGHPDVPDHWRFLAGSLDKLGNRQSNRGQSAEAAKTFERAISIKSRLVADSPSVPDYRAELATSWNNFGITLRTEQNWERADTAFQKAFTLSEKLAVDFPSVPNHRFALANTLHNWGLSLGDQNRFADAEGKIHAALEIKEKLYADFPDNPSYGESLGQTLNSLGVNFSQRGNTEQATQASRRALKIFEGLADRHPAVAGYQLLVASQRGNLATEMFHQGRTAEARKAFEEALLAQDALVEAFPALVEGRKVLAKTQGEYGILLFEGLNRPAEAEAAYRGAIEKWEKLMSEYPDQPEIQVSLGGTLHNLGQLLETREQWGQVRELYERAIVCQRKALAAQPANAKGRQFLRNHYIGHSEICLRLKDHASAAASALELPKLFPALWRAHSTTAALLARCIPIAEADTSLPGEQARTVATSYAEAAVNGLRQAIASGLPNPATLESDPVFSPLRSRPDFQALVRGKPR